MNPIQYDTRVPHPYDADPNWQQTAACREYPTDMFFPHRGTSPRKIREAKLICKNCPIRQKCLDYALYNHELHGIWGGYTEKQRRELRRTTTIKPGPTTRRTISRNQLDTTKCGTNAGYMAHFRLKEQPCDPCRIARNLNQAQAARRRRAKKKSTSEPSSL